MCTNIHSKVAAHGANVGCVEWAAVLTPIFNLDGVPAKQPMLINLVLNSVYVRMNSWKYRQHDRNMQ